MPERVENLMSGTYEHNKIKTPYAHIIVEGTCEKPYFEIEYYDLEKETTFIGYGSYDLSNVFRWLEENFEVEKPTADVAPVVHGKWEPGNPICPVCGNNKFKGLDADVWADWMPPFCPNCGARCDV